MVIIDFLKNLSSEMREYEIEVLWKWKHLCPICGKYYESKDEKRSCEISYFYELDVEDCTILFDHTKIIITHIEREHGNNNVCKLCEGKKQPITINLFEKPMTEQRQIELSNTLARFSEWYEKKFDEDSLDADFHSDLKNLYLTEKMLRTGIL